MSTPLLIGAGLCPLVTECYCYGCDLEVSVWSLFASIPLGYKPGEGLLPYFLALPWLLEESSVSCMAPFYIPLMIHGAHISQSLHVTGLLFLHTLLNSF